MNKKICLAASAGGHLSQLLKIKEAWANEEEVFYVSSLDIVAEKLSKLGKLYIVGECNREKPVETCIVFYRTLKVIALERPAVVISTGAAPGLLCCVWGKVFGAKIVWLDSVANTEKLSLSGRLVCPFADLMLTQWPKVASLYKNVEYAGNVI